KYGVKGLAAAFAVAYIGGVITAFVVISKRVGSFYKEILISFGRILIAGGAMAVLIHFILIEAKHANQPPLISIVVSIILGVPVYFVVGRLCGIREWNLLMRGPLARFAKVAK